MNKRFKFMAKAGSIAAALAITTVTGFAYTTPSTYVSLDVNPSIEYKLNSFDRVISVVAVNEDGEKIVNELDLKNEKITKAVLKTVEKLKDQGYLTEEDYSGIVIAVSNKEQEKSDELASEIEKELNKDDEEKDSNDANDENENTDDVEKDEEDNNEETDEKEYEEDEENDGDDIKLVVEAVGRERVEEARKLNVTPGKLNLVQKLIASTDDFDDISEEQLEELLSLSVKEISKMTNANKKGLEVEFDFEDDLEEETLKTEKTVEEDEDEEVKDVDGKDYDISDKVKNKDKVKVKEEKEKNKNDNKFKNGNNGNKAKKQK